MKFENVCASKTSLTETATNNPRNVDEIAIKRIAGSTNNQLMGGRSRNIDPTIIGTIAFRHPNRIAPLVLENMSDSRLKGASSNRSKEAFFFSKVIVTASMDVVPKSIEIEITPGKRVSMLSRPCPERIKNIVVQARGKMIPQLILGGLR